MSLATRGMVLAKKAHVGLYRRFDAKPIRTIKGMPILLLTVAGRTSGRLITTPVVYLRQGESYVVAGSNGGQQPMPQWFKNLSVASAATIEVGKERTEVSPRVLEGVEYDDMWATLVETAPFFEGYRTRSGRTIPLAVLTPAS